MKKEKQPGNTPEKKERGERRNPWKRRELPPEERAKYITSTTYKPGHEQETYWTLERTLDLFREALLIADDPTVLHLSTIAVRQQTYPEIYSKLIKKYDKPEFHTIKKQIDAKLVSRVSTGALMNEYNANFARFYMSANYHWSEKTEQKTAAVNINSNIDLTKLNDDELDLLERKLLK